MNYSVRVTIYEHMHQVYNKSQAVRVEEKLHIHTSAEKNYSKFNTAVSGFTEINSFVLSITL